jgi:hypothetical protein
LKFRHCFFSYTASLVLFILDVAMMAVRERRFLVCVCNNNACFSSAESGVFVTLLLVHALLEGGCFLLKRTVDGARKELWRLVDVGADVLVRGD